MVEDLRPLEIEAAIGIEQLKKLDAFIEQRRTNVRLFQKRITEETDLLIQKEEDYASWFGFAIILPREKQGRRKVYTDALIEADIEVRPIVAGNFARQKALKYLDYSISGVLENAEYIHENGFYVGNHSRKMNENINYLIDILKTIDLEMD